MRSLPLRLIYLFIIGAGLSACESLAPTSQPLPATVVVSNASVLDGYMEILSALSSPDPARQSDVFYELEKNQAQSPTTMNQLRYAIALALPGHPSSDPVRGKRLLEQTLANPARLTPGEQALAFTMTNVADQWLKIQAETRRLAATVDDRSRAQSNSERRFQAQADELIKLRKALDAAQQKLDAIRDIEKSISERSTTPTGTRDTGNRDSTIQTQTPPASR